MTLARLPCGLEVIHKLYGCSYVDSAFLVPWSNNCVSLCTFTTLLSILSMLFMLSIYSHIIIALMSTINVWRHENLVQVATSIVNRNWLTKQLTNYL